jgi:hypothetical protein
MEHYQIQEVPALLANFQSYNQEIVEKSIMVLQIAALNFVPEYGLDISCKLQIVQLLLFMQLIDGPWHYLSVIAPFRLMVSGKLICALTEILFQTALYQICKGNFQLKVPTEKECSHQRDNAEVGGTPNDFIRKKVAMNLKKRESMMKVSEDFNHSSYSSISMSEMQLSRDIGMRQETNVMQT